MIMKAIQIENLSYQYPDSTRAIDDMSLEIPIGAKVALLGPNGAGKSTLLHHLNGLKLPQHGMVSVMGTPINKKTTKWIRQKVGLVFQDPDDQVFSPTVWEDVQFGPQNLGLPADDIEERCQAALGSVGMLPYKNKPPFHLSFGQKKRVAIAGILAMKPDVVVLDEPMSYLDPQAKDELAALLRGLSLMGKTVIVSTHDVDFAASWADLVLIMKDGKLLIAGGTELLIDKKWIVEAKLHLPKITRLFMLIPSLNKGRLPKTEQEAVQLLSEIIESE
jgi:cobalt/nickel transport system ATP-binding protein